SFAAALAVALASPRGGGNRPEGHLYSVLVEEPHPPFPYLCLTVSGGHTQLVVVREGFRHEVLGATRDDAAGEAFDKVAKMLGLGYPGGPAIDRLAAEGDASIQDFPRTRLENEHGRLDCSFGVLQTPVLYSLNRFDEAGGETHLERHLPVLAASFQAAVVDVLVGAIRDAARATGIRAVAIVGGVSANSALREAARAAGEADGFKGFIPKPVYSVDNAAMIAVTGHFKWAAGYESPLTLSAAPNLAVGGSDG